MADCSILGRGAKGRRSRRALARRRAGATPHDLPGQHPDPIRRGIGGVHGGSWTTQPLQPAAGRRVVADGASARIPFTFCLIRSGAAYWLRRTGSWPHPTSVRDADVTSRGRLMRLMRCSSSIAGLWRTGSVFLQTQVRFRKALWACRRTGWPVRLPVCGGHWRSPSSPGARRRSDSVFPLRLYE